MKKEMKFYPVCKGGDTNIPDYTPYEYSCGYESADKAFEMIKGRLESGQKCWVEYRNKFK